MKNYVLFLLLFVFVNTHAASEIKPLSKTCSHSPAWFRSACQRLVQVWTEGDNELYIPGYAWHNRYKYTPSRVKTYNEQAWGGGLGKSLYDEKGNWHGIYSFAFLDSHKDLEPAAGYTYLKMFPFSSLIKAGFGATVFLTARADINHYLPFPGALPLVSVMVSQCTLSATYIPGHKDIGNVLFIFAKYRF